MKRHRILLVHHGTATGGAFISLLALANRLDPSRFEVMLCNAGNERDSRVCELAARGGLAACTCELPRFAHTTGGALGLIGVKPMFPLFDWILQYSRACRNLRSLLASLQPDLVHFNSVTLAPYSRITREVGVPSVLHVREIVLRGFLGVRRRWLARHVSSPGVAVVAISNDSVLSLGLPLGHGIEVVGNPIDFDRFDFRIDALRARQALGIGADIPTVLFAGGGLAYIKGVFEFIAAMKIVRRKYPQAVSLMPSFIPPPSRSALWQSWRYRIACALGLFRESTRLYQAVSDDDFLAFARHGSFVEDIEQWIAASDVVCVPHIRPHFSRTAVEAGAMKKPVVAFDIGGVNEVVQHDVNGLKVRLGDVGELAASLLRVLDNRALAERLGAGGYELAVRRFDATQHACRIAAIYERLLNRPGTAGKSIA